MNFSKNNKELLVKLAKGVSVLLVVLIVLKFTGYANAALDLNGMIASANGCLETDKEKAKKFLQNRQAVAGKLKGQNAFTAKPPEPQLPVCQGVLGDVAFFKGKAYKVSDEVNGAKILSISTAQVKVMWKGQEKSIETFSGKVMASQKSEKKKPEPENKAKPSAEPQAEPEQNPEPRPDRQRGDRGGRGGRDNNAMRQRFESMSEDERNEYRQKLQDMSREERREYMRNLREQQ